MVQRRVSPEPVIKLRWLIIFPIIAVLLLTAALMVKEYKDQRAQIEQAYVTTIRAV